LALFLVDSDVTEALGRAVGTHAQPGGFVALHGDLGAGKTTVARGIARGLGVIGPVPSPTYTLVAVYEDLPIPLAHADWYRLADADELEQLGWDDLVDGRRVVVVEWPSQVPDALPAERLDVHLEDATGPDGAVGRAVRLTAHGAAHEAVLAAVVAWASQHHLPEPP
jgi:tRNA threonylcarbamoyladenosine biosynthesis protein TsaE